MNEQFTIQKAKEAIIAEREDLALDLLAPLAQQGDPDAQFLYGVLTKSTFWISASAEQNHPEACYFLACATPTPDGFDLHKPVDANGWFLLHKAAELGSIAAQTDLGCFYLNETQNQTEGARWLSLAAQAPKWASSEALYRFGLLLLEGIAPAQEEHEGQRFLVRCICRDESTPYTALAHRLLFDIFENGLYGYKPIEEHQLQVLHEDIDFYLDKFPIPKWHEVFLLYVRRSLVYIVHEMTVDTFANFLFDHFVIDTSEMTAAEGMKCDWKWNVRVEYEPAHIIHLYTLLFRDPVFLFNRFTQEHLEAGFWVTIGRQDWSLDHLIKNQRIPFPLRETCIRSMYNLFDQVFAVDALKTASHMW
jgi:hypothetical protein